MADYPENSIFGLYNLIFCVIIHFSIIKAVMGAVADVFIVFKVNLAEKIKVTCFTFL